MPKIAEILLGFQGGATPYLLVFLILLACGFGVPIPEDITLIAAGILAYYQAANVWIMIAVGLAGVMCGDSAMFWLGRRYGLAFARKPVFAKIMSEARINKVSEILNQRGSKILFAARFMPGLRSPLFFTAGALGVPTRVFLFYDGMAALISVPAIIYSVFYFGSHLEQVISTIKSAHQGILIIIALTIIFFVIKWKRAKNKKSVN